MTINHIDQLAQWWENAEEGDARPGDTIITPGSTHYLIETAPDYPLDRANQPYRILARAPKPKPAWHDAVAVIASMDYCERQVWERDTTYENRWYGTAGDRAVTSDLRVVTPLIEAKVTDEMVTRAHVEMMRLGLGDYSDRVLASIITAALGLETV